MPKIAGARKGLNEKITGGLRVNVKKSCCMRIGARHDKPCSRITTMDGRELVWADEIRYLGVFIVHACYRV